MFSIVIPHKNMFFALDRLLLSIPISNNFQVVVVDDNSDDSCELNNLKTKHTHVKFLDNRSNVSNAGAARNIALKECSRKWILFADSDDIFEKSALEDLENTELDDSIDIYFYRVCSVSSTGTIGKRHENLMKFMDEYINSGEEKYIRYRWGPPWGKIYSKRLIDENNIRFDEVEAANDVMFSLKSGIAARRVSSSSTKLYNVFERENSLTTKTTTSRAASRLDVLIRYNLIAICKKLPIQLYSGNRYFLQTKPWLNFFIYRALYFRFFYMKIRLFQKVTRKI